MPAASSSSEPELGNGTPSPSPSSLADELGKEAPVPPGEKSLWASIREAIHGTEQDLTSIPIRRAVFLLAVPMVLEMSMESLFAVVDIFFVSKIGEDAVATVGLTESMLSLVYALAMGLSAGATALVARRTGEKDSEGAAAAAGQVILTALAGALVLGILGVALSSHLLSAMGASESLIKQGSGYTAVMLGGSLTIFLLFVINAIFRSAGDPSVSMKSLWLANGLNMILAPIFIFGVGPIPRMGVTGAAVATTVSRGIGVGYQILMLKRGRGRLAMKRRHLVPNFALIGDLLRVSAGACFQVLIETASWLGLVRIISLYGSTVLAGYTIAMRIAIFGLLPAWGLSNAASTLVGQNLGAKQPERAKKSVLTIGFYNLVFLSLVSAVFIIAPHPLVALFTPDPSAQFYGADALRIVAVGFVAFAYGMVAIQAFNGAGDTKTPMFVNLACFWFFKLPIAYVMARMLGMGPRGCFLAITLAYSLQSVVSMFLFKRGSWQTKVV